ncbi:MAG: hypothetical protein ACHQRM_13445 [Bacteroidia bacterium]
MNQPYCNYQKHFLLMLYGLLLFNAGFCQSGDSSCVSVPGKDILDVLHHTLKSDRFTSRDTICQKTGRLHISVVPAAAYTLVTRWAVVLAANGAFYTDEKKDANLSLINTSLAYTQNKQIIFPIHTTIWTKENKYNLLGDWRFYQYPQYTYGLGANTHTADAFLLNFSYITIRETLLKSIRPDFFAGLGYSLDYHWNISKLSTQGNGALGYDSYGPAATTSSSGITLNLLYDERRNPINPRAGYYGHIVYRPNFTFLGSDNNWQSLLIDLRKYFFLPGNSSNILAFWSYNWLTLSGKPPYTDLPSTAWDEYNNVGRGYIQSRFRGNNLLYLESEYRFRITPNGLLGGVVFVNVQSVSEWPSNRFDRLLPGMGTGLRIKMNKHSNTNMCIDYGFGIEGSQGIFFGLGEMF